MKLNTNEEIYNYVLKEVQKWFVEKYYGRILQSFTFEARKILGVTPILLALLKKIMLRYIVITITQMEWLLLSK